MRRIQELSEQLANQIAAGEVVERPASVVKELIENAIDAGATQIQIFVEESGLKTIEIIDNGVGILQEDVEAAFKRHATSKILNREDLFRIQTLGFRGEALPSIASVSEITLETAVQEENSGTYLKLSGGVVQENKPAPLRVGTKIKVENLFFNTPARLKYVKTLQTELAKIGDIVNRLALSHPNIAFRLVSDDNQMLTTNGNGELKTAIAGIYGLTSAKKMLEISASDLDFEVHGFVSLPELTRASNNYISIMINGRYIKNYNINRSILAGYGSKIMGGRFPIAVIEIKMGATLVDVNVHPTKQEVRLSKERELMGLITSAIQEVLREERLIPQALEGISFKQKQEKPTFKPVQTVFSVQNQTTEETPNFEKIEKTTPSLQFDPTSESFFVEETVTPLAESAEIVSPTNNVAEPIEPEDPNHPDISSQEIIQLAEKMKEDISDKKFPHLEYFGQMHGTYLFAQSYEGLYIVDQHAAQERIKYEYYREEIGNVSEDLQELLIPIVLDFPNSDVLKIKEQKSLLEEVGIFLEEYGPNAFVLRKHPIWYPQGLEENTAREMIDMLLMTGQVSVKKFREELAIMMSCKRSIKANHSLDDAQARMLLIELAKCKNPYNCPHGRPVLIHLSNYDMEKMFKRIQDPHETFKK